MRAMILAAGLGTRLRPLTLLRAKPALPVCGRPVIRLLLELLAKHGVEETLINLHYLPESIRRAVDEDPPKGMTITWSEEPTPLGTGGGIRRAAEFLRGSPECLVLAGDMLLDMDLTTLRRRHVESGRDVTLILRRDARGAEFGTIGLDGAGRILRIGSRPLEDASSGADAAGEAPRREADRGLFTGVRFFSRAALTGWPPSETFEDLRDWLAPAAAAGSMAVGGEILEAESTVWEPVGTPSEYLAVNLDPPLLPSLGGDASHWAGPLQPALRGTPEFPGREDRGNVVSASARLLEGVEIQDCVVWDEEEVPVGFQGRNGVYAGGRFHPCGPEPSGSHL